MDAAETYPIHQGTHMSDDLAVLFIEHC